MEKRGGIYDRRGPGRQSGRWQASSANCFVMKMVKRNRQVGVPENFFCKDDIVLLANRFPLNGEYAFFYIGDRAHLRKFVEEDGLYKLQCIHNIGEEFVMKRMELEYIGTYCGVVRT